MLHVLCGSAGAVLAEAEAEEGKENVLRHAAHTASVWIDPRCSHPIGQNECHGNTQLPRGAGKYSPTACLRTAGILGERHYDNLPVVD